MWTLLMLLSCIPLPANADTASCPKTAPSTSPRASGEHVLVVNKSKRRLGLYSRGTLATVGDAPACWPIGLASTAPTGPKQRQGDLKTPEGWYRTSDKPWSSYAGAIAVHYPNASDASAAEKDGRIDKATADRIRTAIAAHRKPPQNTSLGGEILIHGGGAWDWTLGCIALEDGDLQTLRDQLPDQKKVDLLILP